MLESAGSSHPSLSHTKHETDKHDENSEANTNLCLPSEKSLAVERLGTKKIMIQIPRRVKSFESLLNGNEDEKPPRLKGLPKSELLAIVSWASEVPAGILPTATPTTTPSSEEDESDCASDATDNKEVYGLAETKDLSGHCSDFLRFGNEALKKATKKVMRALSKSTIWTYQANQDGVSQNLAGSESIDSSTSTPAKRSFKRNRGSGDSGSYEGDGDSEGDNNDKKKRKTAPRSDQSAVMVTRFACPYYKRNPTKHQDWRSCAGPGWETVHRAKYVLFGN
jgi:hypothetical protein